MKLSGDMMECLRGRRNLAEDDTSQDAQIEAMSPVEIVKECGAWRLGYRDWANIFAHWMKTAGAKPDDFA